jgi:two-component sensor histidine kinase
LAKLNTTGYNGGGHKGVWDRVIDAALSIAAGVRAIGTPRASLRTHLFIFAVALILPLLFLIGLALTNIVSSEIAKTRERLVRTAENISRTVDREIAGYITVLKTLSTSELLDRGDLPAFHMRAKAALADRDAHVLLLDLLLAQLVNTRVPYGTPLPKTADEDSARLVLETRSPQVSDAFIGSVSGRWVVNVEVPVIRDDAVKYILLITVDIEHFSPILSGARAAEGQITALSDRKGQPISMVPGQSAPSIPAIFEDLGMSTVPTIRSHTDDQGHEWVEGFVWSGLTGWRTAVVVPQSEINTVLWMSVRWFCFALIVAALLTIALGTTIGRRLAHPITEIKLATVGLARGKPIEPRSLHLAEADEVMSALSRTSALISTRTARLQESEERSREQVRQIDTLMHELAHRNKNQLSVISAMARQLAGTSDSVSEFQEKFVQRISAMAEAQNLLSQAVASGVSLQHLLDNQIRPFAGENSPQVTASGPEAFLTSEAARTIGMAFHELATNATKYGALRQPDGRVSVTWSILEPDRKLKIVWRENGVPRMPTPERSGFGSVIIEKYVARTLDADVTYAFEETGIVWTLEAADILA